MKKFVSRRAVICICILCQLFLFCSCGTVLVNYALLRHDGKKDSNRNLIDPGQMTSPETMSDEYPDRTNYDVLNQQANEWVERFKPEIWEIRTEDGLRLEGDFFRNKDSHRYAVVVHGYTGKRSDLYTRDKLFYEWGFNVLAPDNRSHGKSDGKYIGMGWLDSNDLLVWINRVVQEDSEARIVLYGSSMGGATVMMASGLDLPQNVRCIVEDCGYTSVWDEFDYLLRNFLHRKSGNLLKSMDRASKRLASYGIIEASSVNRLSEAKIPVMFIHGTADTFVPYRMIDDNIEAYKGPYSEVLRVEGAGHGASYYKNTELYTKAVKTFTDKFTL